MRIFLKVVKYIYKKWILFVVGTLSLIIGIIGIFLPLLPTTPLLLLSAFCYLHSSEKMYKWLMGNRLVGKYIYNYMNYKAVNKRTKIITIVFLWGTLLISFFIIYSAIIRVILILVGVGVTTHILMLKTMED